MKQLFLLFISICITLILQGQVVKTIDLTAGTINTALTPEELNTVTNLTITGTMDARDFKTLRDSMPALAVLDISQVTILSYYGTEGTDYSFDTFYPANEIPILAFYNIENQIPNISLTTVTLPNSTTAIGESAFLSCHNLTTIGIPSSVTMIGINALGDCISLSDLYLYAGIIHIGIGAFWGTRSMITVDENNPNYGTLEGVLFNKDFTTLIHCPTQKSGSYTVPSTVSTLEDGAFWLCTNLQSVILPGSLTSMGNSIFYGCSALTSIIANSPYPVDLSNRYGVFQGVNTSACTLEVPFGSRSSYLVADQWNDFSNLIEATNGFILNTNSLNIPAENGSSTTVNISSNVEWTAGHDLSWLIVEPTTGTGNQEITITAEGNASVLSRSGEITFTSTGFVSQTLTVTQEGENKTINILPGGLLTALTEEELNGITHLTISGSMDARDFRMIRDNLANLIVLDLKPVNIVSYSGIEGTRNDEYFAYEENSIPNYAFFNQAANLGKPGLTTVILPNLVTTIQTYAFKDCKDLTSIDIPNGLNYIRSGVFENCEGLPSITIPSSVTQIESDAFLNCSALINVAVDNFNYSSMDGVLFNKDKTALLQCPTSKTGEYIIPSTVIMLGYYAFNSCDQLTSVFFPASVDFIDRSTFINCSAVFSVATDHPKYSSLEGVLYNKDQTWLEGYPASKLGEFVIPSSVTTIGSLAFAGSIGLTSLTIPATVTFIGPNAFAGCNALELIIVESPYPIDLSASYSVFDGVNPFSSTLRVPYGSKQFYSTAAQWKTLTNIIENPNGFILSGTSINLPAEGGSNLSIQLTANVAWTASSNQEWLTVNPSSGNSNSNLQFTAAPNESVTIRTAEVTFSAQGTLSHILNVTQTGIPKTVQLIAGGLFSLLTAEEMNGITHLTITGNLDARDFKTMRDEMPMLAVLDLSGTVIAAYNGGNGTVPSEVNYPANELPEYAFFNSEISTGKTSLQSVILPSRFQTIGSVAFQGCTGLTSILLPQSVTTIEGAAFANCTGLISIDVKSPVPPDLPPNSSVFDNINLNNCTLNVPYGTKPLYAVADQWKDFINIIEDGDGFHLSNFLLNLAAAEGSSNTMEVTANKAWTVSSDDSWVSVNPTSGTGNQILTFSATANPLATLRTATITVSAAGEDSQVITLHQSGQPKTVDVTAGNLLESLTPDERNGITQLTVTGTIDARDFKTLRDEIPLLSLLDLSGATVIAYSGLEGTGGNLVTEYPANEVPDWAFLINNTGEGKTSLTSVVLPSTINSIGSASFNRCSNLNSITIPSSVSYIGEFAFYGCKSLTLIELPSSLLAIENGTFFECNSLADISIPSMVTTIGNDAFSSCFNLSSVVLPPSLTSIGNGAFYYCSSLTTIDIPSSVTTIGQSAFTLCTSLTLVNLPLSLTFIGENAFANCSNLVSVNIPSSLNLIRHSTFSGCSSLTSIMIPSSVTTIGSYAFEGCTSLLTVDLPSSVTTIEAYAFSNCTGLTSITLPSSVTSIGSMAFYQCTGLSTFNVHSAYPVDLSSSESVFLDVNVNTCLLKVPYQTRERYASAYQWKDFKNIQEETEGFMMDLNNIDFQATGGTSIVNIAANVTWTASSDQSWLTMDPASGTGDQAITFTAETNSTAAVRKSIVTVSATEVSSQFITIIQQGQPKTVEATSGNLRTALTTEELIGITHLIITGTIDARDFKTMRDEMPLLAVLDMSGATIATYSGTEGTVIDDTQYPANEVPLLAFIYPNTNIGKVSLVSVRLPNTLTSIGVSAFYGCTGLTSIIIPSSVTLISYGAFAYCSGLTSIHANPGIPVDLSNSPSVFDGINKAGCILYVPTGSKALYQAANQWQDFYNMEEGTVGIRESMESATQIKCYPNPFTQQITIEILNPDHEKMTVDIYNMAGQRVKNLAIGNTSGQLTITWDGRNEQGQQAVSGVYILRMNGEIVKLMKW